MVWVEPSWSLSASGMTNSLKLTRKVDNIIPHQHRTTSRSFTPELSETLFHLLSCTEPKIAGMISGYMAVANIREYIYYRVNEFPLLNVVGVSGSGKTKTVSMFATLSSADFLTESPPIVSGLTPLPIKLIGVESESPVRIFDECSKPKLVALNKWPILREVLKASAQKSAIRTGVLTGKTVQGEIGGGSLSETVSSPLVFLSTSKTDEPELWNRSVVVEMHKHLHHMGDYGQHYKVLEKSPQHKENLFAISRIFMLDALYQNEAFIWQLFEEEYQKIPDTLDNRVHNMYTWVFLGLKYLMYVVKRRGGSPELVEKAQSLYDEASSSFNKEAEDIQIQKSRNEMDIFFDMLGAAMTRLDNQGKSSLVKNYHYFREKDALYLQVPAVFGVYLSTCRWMSQAPEFSNARDVTTALLTEPYYLCEERRSSPSGGPILPWAKVSTSKLQKRDHDLARFE